MEKHFFLLLQQHLTQGPQLGMLSLHSPHAPMSPTGRRLELNPVSISHRTNNIVLELTHKISEHKARDTYIFNHLSRNARETFTASFDCKTAPCEYRRKGTTNMQNMVLPKKPHIHPNSMVEQRFPR